MSESLGHLWSPLFPISTSSCQQTLLALVLKCSQNPTSCPPSTPVLIQATTISCQDYCGILLLFFNVLFIYLFIFERETEYELGRGRERGRQNPQSRLQVLSPTQGLNPWTMRSWPEPKSDAQPTEPPRRPRILLTSASASMLLLSTI